MTTTDIEVLPPQTSLAPLTANPGQSRHQQLDDLRSEAEFLEVAMGLAERACGNGGQLVAQHFRGKPVDGAIAIAYGSSLGWHWTKALQDVYVVNGKPSIQSKEIRELLIRAGHEIWEEEVGPTRVVLAGRRRGSELVVRVEWTMEKAEKAKLTSNPNYAKFPENMLYARCTTDLGKRLAPDALSGLGVVEELTDMGFAEQPVRVRSERASGGASIRERAQQAQDDAPAEQPAGTADTPETDLRKAARKKLSDAIFATFGDLKLGGDAHRADRLVVIAAIVGRPVESSKELTDDELQKLRNRLIDGRRDGTLDADVTEWINAAARAAENANTEGTEAE